MSLEKERVSNKIHIFDSRLDLVKIVSDLEDMEENRQQIEERKQKMSEKKSENQLVEQKDYVATVIRRPFIPFLSDIPSGVNIGTTLIVRARVPRYAEKFTFNFLVGNNMEEFICEGGDVAMQFSVRFDDDGVVGKNSRISNHMGNEERQKKDFPFRRMDWFEAMFVVKPSYFVIIINGYEFGLFLHRIPFTYIGMFSIDGDIEVESVVFTKQVGQYLGDTFMIRDLNHNDIVMRKEVSPEGRRRYKSSTGSPQQQAIRSGRSTGTPSPSYSPNLYPRSPRLIKKVTSENRMTQTDPNTESTNVSTQIQQRIEHSVNYYGSLHSIEDNVLLSQKTIYNPPMAFSYSFLNGLKKGMIITINGHTKQSPNKFFLRFQKGPTPDDSRAASDIGLHLGVNFNKDVVVRKTRIDGKWIKREDSADYFPFKSPKSNQYFELKVRVELHGRFIIDVNGIYFTEYLSGISDVESLDVLEIDGDINVVYVKIDACQSD